MDTPYFNIFQGGCYHGKEEKEKQRETELCKNAQR